MTATDQEIVEFKVPDEVCRATRITHYELRFSTGCIQWYTGQPILIKTIRIITTRRILPLR